MAPPPWTVNQMTSSNCTRLGFHNKSPAGAALMEDESLPPKLLCFCFYKKSQLFFVSFFFTSFCPVNFNVFFPGVWSQQSGSNTDNRGDTWEHLTVDMKVFTSSLNYSHRFIRSSFSILTTTEFLIRNIPVMMLVKGFLSLYFFANASF